MPAGPYVADARYDALTGGRAVRQERYLLAKHAHIDPDAAGRLSWHWYQAMTAQVLEEISEGEYHEDADRPPALAAPDRAESAGVVVRQAQTQPNP